MAASIWAPGARRPAPNLRAFGVKPSEARPMWREASSMLVGCWTEDEYSFEGEYWQMPKRRVLPKPIQEPHPALWGATSSEAGHRQMGESGLGLCSFAVGTPPEDIAKRHRDLPRGHR